MRCANTKSRAATDQRKMLTDITNAIKSLLDRIDREIPLLQIAITGSGESLSTSLPTGISPSRLLQAGTFLMFGDTQFAQDPDRAVQIGPVFTLSVYMLFLGHASTVQSAKNIPKSDCSSKCDISFKATEPKCVYGLGEKERKPLWQEVLHKARVRLCRTRADYGFDGALGYRLNMDNVDKFPPIFSSSSPVHGNEYSYHLEIVEDLDDGRVHEDETDCEPYDDIANAGIRESIPIHQISKVFYTDMGRILNIGNATEGENHPALLLKRDMQALPNEKALDGLLSYLEASDIDYDNKSTRNSDVAQYKDHSATEKQIRRESRDLQTKPTINQPRDSTVKWKFPSHLDPEWIALEVFEDDEEDALESNEEDTIGLNEDDADSNGDMRRRLQRGRGRSSLDSKFIDQIKKLSLGTSTNPSTPQRKSLQKPNSLAPDIVETPDFVARSPFGSITTSLSLMEMLIRLASLQEYQQASYLSIPDHVLSFFLEETSTTGLVGETQWRARREAKRRMGFDPYTDTPTK